MATEMMLREFCDACISPLLGMEKAGYCNKKVSYFKRTYIIKNIMSLKKRRFCPDGLHPKPSPKDYDLYDEKHPGPFVTIDLNKGPAERWNEAIEKDLSDAKRIVKAGMKDFPQWVQMLAAWGGASLFGAIYRFSGGPHDEELEAWASKLKINFGLLAMINCAYELEQLRESFLFPPFASGKRMGCSAAVVELAGGEPVHVRNLDWPIQNMGGCTRIYEFKRGDHRFLVVGFPGAVGALSGMVPGQYSVTINWAPPQTFPNLEYAPSLLLRKVLEECPTYQEAVERLKRTRLCTSVFYMVCGTNPGESCLIERTPDDCNARLINNGYIVQTNHFDEPGWFSAENQKLTRLLDDYLVVTTRERRRDLEGALRSVVGASLEDPKLIGVLDQGKDVTNFETCQRMIFRPRAGTIYLQTLKDDFSSATLGK